MLFLYEPYDELVLMNLAQFDRKTLKSVENEIQEDADDSDKTDEKGDVYVYYVLQTHCYMCSTPAVLL